MQTTLTVEDIQKMNLNDLSLIKADILREISQQRNCLSQARSVDTAENITTDIYFLENLLFVINTRG